MHAVLVKVRIDPARWQEAVDGLKAELVPRVKSAPGFVRGTWFGNQTSGNSLMLFDSEENASQMAKMVSAGPDDPVQIEDVQVYQVHADA